ncbi:MAG: hypothetical protein AAF492_26150, partial [Verrucomicrobiota bacterium]
GAAREMLNGLRPLSPLTPTESVLGPPGCAGDDATICLGFTNITSGLTLRQPGDGGTFGVTIGGYDARRNGPDASTDFYFYFDIDDTLVYSNVAGQAATIEVEFFDNNPATRFRLQYDGVTNLFTRHPRLYNPPGNGGWKIMRWDVTDGLFANRQNGSSDFRMALFPNETAVIRRVSVFFPEEEPGGKAAESLRVGHAGQAVEWPATYDAVGWRLYETDDLLGTDWQPCTNTFTISNGLFQVDMDSHRPRTYYRLQREARR